MRCRAAVMIPPVGAKKRVKLEEGVKVKREPVTRENVGHR